jgi:hypothetical protein
VAIPSGAVGNGLPADDWARLDSVPFPVMQHLMVALRGAGIPAYAVADIDESPLRALNRRSPLHQRVYVDRSRLDAARAVMLEELRAHEQALMATAVDTEFANLVANLRVNDPITDVDDIPELREEHFEPPVPEVHFTTDPVARAAWVGVLGGPILLVLSLIGILTLGGLAPSIAIIAFIAGFITLVIRMPERDTTADEGPDDGAVV